MIRDNYLDINKIVKNKSVFKLFEAVESHGGVLRFVGGCVRDALKGISGFDLDLAVDLSPEELVEACEDSGLRTIPIGIKFGTVGVIISENCILEVTSLRKDIKTDGRHAEVVFTTDWEEDASRRDLTINAVYADEKGNVFDYYNGIDDLEKGVVRFIGSPSQRIKEDYLRILRFFRFYSIFSKTPVDEKALKACREQKDGLKNLSMERIRDEMQKILLTDNVVQTLKIMKDNEILGSVMPDIKNLEKLDFLIKLVDKELLPHEAMRRLFILYTPDITLASSLANRMKMTKKQKQHFISWAETNPEIEELTNEKILMRLMYKYGKEFCVDKLLLTSADKMQEIVNLHDIIEFINNAVVPSFPISGRDIITQGIDNHHKIGSTLESLEDIWLESGFSLSKEDLLNINKKLQTA